MSGRTGIEWTDTTWNPVVGCSVVSPGCTNCYAMRMAARLEAMGGKTGAKYAGLTARSKAGPVWNGTVRLDETALEQPLCWKRPRKVFVNSMSDLFHEDLPFGDIARVFRAIGATIRAGRGHVFQILTKRPARMAEYFDWATADPDADRIMPAQWPGVWLGVSAEDQRRADERIPILLGLPASRHWVSAEPLLGPLSLATVPYRIRDYRHLDWVVVGGESGPGARPMHPDWARSLCDQCVAAKIPFYFKQWGDWSTCHPGYGPCGAPHDFGDGTLMVRYGKKAAGRLLDGRAWDQYPDLGTEARA